MIQGVHCGSGWEKKPLKQQLLGLSVEVTDVPEEILLGFIPEPKNISHGSIDMQRVESAESALPMELKYLINVFTVPKIYENNRIKFIT